MKDDCKPINDHTTGPEDYWRTTPRDLIIDVYRHYFQDFLTFGFSPESVMKYIDAGLDGNETIRNKYESNKKLSKVLSKFSIMNICHGPCLLLIHNHTEYKK